MERRLCRRSCSTACIMYMYIIISLRLLEFKYRALSSSRQWLPLSAPDTQCAKPQTPSGPSGTPLYLFLCPSSSLSALHFALPPSPRQAVRSAREMDRLTRLQPGRSDPNIVRVQQAVIIAFASALVGGVVVSTSTMELDCKGGRGGGFSFGKSKPSRFFALWLMMMTR